MQYCIALTVPHHFLSLKGTCSYQEFEVRPWWQVDLGKLKTVVAVDIYSKCGVYHGRKHTHIANAFAVT